MQKKLQNPLAAIRFVTTDNAVGFETGNTDGTSTMFSLQALYAMDFPEKRFSFLPRVVLPFLSLEPGTYVPRVGEPTPSLTQSTSGVGDLVLQLLFAPYVDGGWKWGGGPTVSFPTASETALQGPQWGAGLAGVLVGNFTPRLSFAGIVSNQWGDEGRFNTFSLQPMLFFELAPARSLAYNAVITANWKADSSNRWTLPLGVSYNQTWALGESGHGLDFMVGPYWNVVRPDGAARWQVRFAVTWLFP